VKKNILKLIVIGCVASCPQLFADVHYYNGSSEPQTITIRKDTFSVTVYESIRTWENSGWWEQTSWSGSGFDFTWAAWWEAGFEISADYRSDHSDSTWEVTVQPGGSADYGDDSFAYTDYSDTVTRDETGPLNIEIWGNSSVGGVNMWQETFYERVEENSATAGYYIHLWY
jgi:hypothetical protein